MSGRGLTFMQYDCNFIDVFGTPSGFLKTLICTIFTEKKSEQWTQQNGVISRNRNLSMKYAERNN